MLLVDAGQHVAKAPAGDLKLSKSVPQLKIQEELRRECERECESEKVHDHEILSMIILQYRRGKGDGVESQNHKQAYH
jgi:hypothetical protein